MTITFKRVISFKPSWWLANYINDNNKLRTDARANGDDLLVSFFKLMNNSVFGKTMEDVRNRETCTSLSTEKMHSTGSPR